MFALIRPPCDTIDAVSTTTHTDAADPEWIRCESCDGAAIASGYCLAHADGSELEGLLRDSGPVDARGTTLTAEHLELILEALARQPGTGEGQEPRRSLLLTRSTILAPLDLGSIALGGDLDLNGASISGDVILSSARIAGRVSVSGVSARRVRIQDSELGSIVSTGGEIESIYVYLCRVREGLHLSNLTASGAVAVLNTSFGEAVHVSRCRAGEDFSLTHSPIAGPVHFHDNMVDGEATFEGSTFGSEVSILDCTIQGELRFGTAIFDENLTVYRSSIGGLFSLHSTQVKGDYIDIGQCTFGAEGVLGPASVIDSVGLKQCEFAGQVTADLSFVREGKVDLTGSRFRAGLTARLSNTEIFFSRVEIQAPSVIGPSSALSTGAGAGRPPKLIELVGTNVANLTLSGADLSACRFSGAFNLDQLRINGPLQLVGTVSYRARRKVLAEEHRWRFVHSRRESVSWYPAACRPLDRPMPRNFDLSTAAPTGLHTVPPRSPAVDPARRMKARDEALEIAAVYRSLRKGLEDSKDEPGAADFYYGEMEMRRKAAAFGFERTLLALYWMISGYGLRAWRAVVALSTVIILSATGLALVGFQPSKTTVYRPAATAPGSAPLYEMTTVNGPVPGWQTAFEYAVQSTTALLRAPSNPPVLTAWGQAIEVILRLGGPALLALIVLAVRGRIKR